MAMREGSDARRFTVKLTMAVAVVVMVCAVVYLAWTQSFQEEALGSKVLAEARTLNTEMRAVWDYIDDAQPAINTNADGSYDFKGIYCSVAGKGIAKRFTRESNDYLIRYVRENPRSGTDEPDSFERVALNHFTVGGSTEHYELTTYEGRPAFRYASALLIKPNCLSCHGEPAGTPDETGFIREGMELGDVAGAVSIVIPVDSYVREAQEGMARSVLFFCVLVVAIVAVLLLAMRRWVSAPLERANRQLENENKQKTDFLATMSHELRTPLSSIIAFTDIWEKSHAAEDSDERKLVEEIKQNSSVLLNMVNNTIDAAKLEAGCLSMQYSDVDMVDVVEAVFAVAEPLAIKEVVALDRSVDPEMPFLHSDAEALRKIMLNLVSNGLKYTPEGGSVRVSVRSSADGRQAVMRVADTGCGIRPENFEAIFEKFDRPGAGEDGPISGSGLGLFLVKSLTEKLGGTVEVESEIGHGSVFTVRVPFDGPAAEE